MDLTQSVGFNGLKDQREAGSTGVLKRASPTHCPTRTSRQLPEGLMLLDIRNSGKWLELANGFHAAAAAAPPPGQTGQPPTEDHPRPSSHIPVPRHRLACSSQDLGKDGWLCITHSNELEDGALAKFGVEREQNLGGVS
ncbi:hypothetical protein CRUP_002602 [Coryphaenoides rupestris]|nr:hypothetical protein CRUP_002602 [Coryphaenoides rupestris]